ncbi:Uncharacterised protein [Bordetella pertussis]|nr:Uncharacterised protein [Bordetella pertussis]
MPKSALPSLPSSSKLALPSAGARTSTACAFDGSAPAGARNHTRCRPSAWSVTTS